MPPIEFKSNAVRPIEALKQGFELIRDRYWFFLGVCLVGVLIGQAFALVLLGPMMCGIYLCFFAKQKGEPLEFGKLFKGFDFFLPSFIATAIQMIPIMAIVVGGYVFIIFYFFLTQMNAASPPSPAEVQLQLIVPLLVFVGIILVVANFLAIFFFSTYPLIVDHKLSGFESIKISIKAALKNFGGLFLWFLLNFILTLIGLALCYVGAIFYLPVSLAAHFVIYQQIFGKRGIPA